MVVAHLRTSTHPLLNRCATRGGAARRPGESLTAWRTVLTSATRWMAYCGLALSGGLLGFALVSWLPRRASVPEDRPPPAAVPDARRVVGARPHDLVRAPETEAPEESDVDRALDEAVRAFSGAHPDVLRTTVRALGRRISAGQIPRDSVARRAEIAAASESQCVIDGLMVAIGGSDPAGLDWCAGRLESLDASASSALRIAHMRACAHTDGAVVVAAGRFGGSLRGDFVIAGFPLRSAKARAALLAAYDRADVAESAIRVEALACMSGELGDLEVASRVARSIRAPGDEAERSFAISLARRILDEGMESSSAVLLALRETLASGSMARMELRSKLEGAPVDGGVAAIVEAALLSPDPADRLALAESLAESQRLWALAVTDEGRSLADATARLATDGSRAVRTVAATAVARIARQSGGRDARLVDALFALAADAQLSLTVRGDSARELAVLSTAKSGESIRARLQTLVASDAMDADGRSRIIDAIRGLKSGNVEFNAWRTRAFASREDVPR